MADDSWARERTVIHTSPRQLHRYKPRPESPAMKYLITLLIVVFIAALVGYWLCWFIFGQWSDLSLRYVQHPKSLQANLNIYRVTGVVTGVLAFMGFVKFSRGTNNEGDLVFHCVVVGILTLVAFGCFGVIEATKSLM